MRPTAIGLAAVLIAAASSSAQGQQPGGSPAPSSRIAILDGTEGINLPEDAIVWTGTSEEAALWRNLLRPRDLLAGGAGVLASFGFSPNVVEFSTVENVTVSIRVSAVVLVQPVNNGTAVELLSGTRVVVGESAEAVKRVLGW